MAITISEARKYYPVTSKPEQKQTLVIREHKSCFQMHKLGMKEFDFGIYTNMQNLCIGERNKFIGATLY